MRARSGGRAEGEDSRDDQVGITDSTIAGNLSLTTGSGCDLVGIGQHEDFNQLLADLLDEVSGYEIVVGSVWVQGKATVVTGNADDFLRIGDCTVKGLVGPREAALTTRR